MWYRHLIALVLIFTTFNLAAQSVGESNLMEQQCDGDNNFTKSKSFDILKVGVPLIAAGVAIQPSKVKFQNLRNSYIPQAHTVVDDYTQYLPAALMLGLKGAGIESRSSWGRMLTADAFTAIIVTLAVNRVKCYAEVKRPDSNARNSFPSGHTTTAFMTATMLHKEYGKVNHWYSVGGYSLAAATGLMRIANNRHWVSDVLAGAGIGIISTELGYLLADIIFKDRGINRDLDGADETSWADVGAPSSMGLYIGVEQPIGDLYDNITLSSGSRVGLEGGYFFGDHVGVGGRLSLANLRTKIDGELDIATAEVGALFSFPVSRRWRFGSKALVGINYTDKLMVNESIVTASGVRPSVSTGASVEYLANRHWAMRLFCDYNAGFMPTLSQLRIYQSATIGFAGNVIF